nr:outer membrane protein [Candidatus Cloacimonadota bacterium]
MKHCLILILMLPIALVANVYTLEQLIDHGMENSFQIQKEELNKSSSYSSFRSAKWNLIPNANLTGGINHDLDPISSSTSTTSSAGFEISKTISLNDPAYFNYRFAKLDRETADIALRQSYSNYAFQVFQAYVSVLSDTKRKSSLEKNLAIQMRVWEQNQVLQRLGKVTPFDVKQSEIAVMNSRISLIQLENTIKNGRDHLFGLVQMEDMGFPLAELDIEIEKGIPEYNTDDMLQIKLLEQDLKRHDINLTRSFLDYFPSMSLGYNYTREVGGADFDFDQYRTIHGLNLNLSYSLWNVFTNKESSTRTKINKDIALLNLAETEDQSRREYDNLKQKLEYLLRLDELYTERLQQAQEQIQIAEERYRLGLIQLLELDRSRTDYIDADIEYNSNLYQIIQTQEEINLLLSKSILGKW